MFLSGLAFWQTAHIKLSDEANPLVLHLEALENIKIIFIIKSGPCLVWCQLRKDLKM